MAHFPHVCLTVKKLKMHAMSIKPWSLFEPTHDITLSSLLNKRTPYKPWNTLSCLFLHDILHMYQNSHWNFTKGNPTPTFLISILKSVGSLLFGLVIPEFATIDVITYGSITSTSVWNDVSLVSMSLLRLKKEYLIMVFLNEP